MTSFFKSKINPIFFIAEIGGNHEGDYNYARNLTQLAIDSGADAIKFQFYTGDGLVSRKESPDRNKHFKKFELSKAQNIELLEMVRDADRIPMASVWEEEMLAWADQYLPIHKVGSGDLTCYPMLKALVATGKPIILSTGLSDMDEVSDAVNYIGGLDASYIKERKLALLQCTSSYPTPDEDANLGVISTFKQKFDLPTGYSDHTLGSDALDSAIALGAEIIEKHFTDTREGKTFRDHKISLTSSEVRSFLERAGIITVHMGKGEKFLTPSERDAEHHISFRRSVYAASDIATGDVFTHENLTVLRPCHGISAARFDEVIGKVAKRPFSVHDVVREEDIK